MWRHPAAAKAWAVARPMPRGEAAPVIIAVYPAREVVCSRGWRRWMGGRVEGGDLGGVMVEGMGMSGGGEGGGGRKGTFS